MSVGEFMTDYGPTTDFRPDNRQHHSMQETQPSTSVPSSAI
jgi:hypothetical protein